jgi:site-specific recombinase XerD
MKGHTTMKNAINDYLKFVQKSRSPKTHITYKTSLQSFLDIVGDDAPISKETYIKFLKTSSDMNPSTQALCRSAIKGLYIFAADLDSGIDTAFFEQVNKTYALKPAKRLVMFNMEGIEKIIQYMNTMRSDKPEDLRDRTFILLLADSGLRISEACNLKVGDIDLHEQKAVVMGKGSKEAVVHFSDRTTGAIIEYLKVRYTAQSTPLFLRHDKRAHSTVRSVKPDGMWHAVKRRAIEAGVDPKTVRVHDFRHYFVTVVYHAKGIRLAQKLARHERIETTSRYTHLVEDEGEAYNEIFNH